MTKCYDLPNTSPNSGNIIFIAANQVEVLRFEANGDAFVRGEKVDNNQEVYREAVAFFRSINQANIQEKPMSDNKKCPHCETSLRPKLYCEIEEETSIVHDVERCRNVLKSKLDRMHKGMSELIGEEDTYCQEFGCPAEKIDADGQCVKCGKFAANKPEALLLWSKKDLEKQHNDQCQITQA